MWDQIIGSYFDPRRQFAFEVGVGRMENFPTGWLGLQRVPFDWSRIKARNAVTWPLDQPSWRSGTGREVRLGP